MKISPKAFRLLLPALVVLGCVAVVVELVRELLSGQPRARELMMTTDDGDWSLPNWCRQSFSLATTTMVLACEPPSQETLTVLHSGDLREIHPSAALPHAFQSPMGRGGLAVEDIGYSKLPILSDNKPIGGWQVYDRDSATAAVWFVFDRRYFVAVVRRGGGTDDDLIHLLRQVNWAQLHSLEALHNALVTT